MSVAFHEVLFPVSVALAGSGGPERKTEIVITGSGREERIARWADSRRKYDAGSGVKTLAELAGVLAFFEERRGRLYGFRWRDRVDFQSCAIGQTPSPLDQAIGMFSNCLGAKLISRSVAANPRGIPVLTGVADAQNVWRHPISGRFRDGDHMFQSDIYCKQRSLLPVSQQNASLQYHHLRIPQ